MSYGNITDVPGIKVGNWEDEEALTGCTVATAEEGAVCGVEVRGSAPGTRETDLLRPTNLVEKVHAITLTGGSAFGLDAASGVMQYLEEKGFGQDMGVAKVPIVPAAVIFDLLVGDADVRPDKSHGYQAASQAKTGYFDFGNIGAGSGATVGKVTGSSNAMKGGLGSASIPLKNGVVVGALVVVNAVGEIRNPEDGQILAGALDPKTGKLLDSIDFMENNMMTEVKKGENTTIGMVAMNVSLTKSEATKVAQVVQNALARTIYPSHTMMDGDTIFAMATGGKKYPVDVIANASARAMETAIVNAIRSADEVQGIQSHTSYNRE